MGLFDFIGSLLGGGSDSSGSESSSVETPKEESGTWERVRSSVDDTGTYRQSHLKGEKADGGIHENTWSTSTSDGRHKEGWHGKEFETKSNRRK